MTLLFSQNNIPGTRSKCTHFKENIDIRTSNIYQKEKQILPVGGKQGSEPFACLWGDVLWSWAVWFLFKRIKWWWRWAGPACLPLSWWTGLWEMRWNTLLVLENLLMIFLLVCDWQWNHCPHVGINTSGPVCNPQDCGEGNFSTTRELLLPMAPKQSRAHQAGSHHNHLWDFLMWVHMELWGETL